MTAIGPFSHLVCWVDGTDQACRAAERATDLARNLGAGLSFLALGAEPPSNTAFDEYAQIEGVSEPLSPTLSVKVDTCLAKAMSHAAKAGVTNVSRVVRTEDAMTALCATVRALNADLVLVGRPNARRIGRITGASVPNRLITSCAFAVLSVA